MSVLWTWFLIVFLCTFLGVIYISFHEFLYLHGIADQYIGSFPVVAAISLTAIFIIVAIVFKTLKPVSAIISKAEKDPKSITEEDRVFVANGISKVNHQTTVGLMIAFIVCSLSCLFALMATGVIPFDIYRVFYVAVQGVAIGLMEIMYCVNMFQNSIRKKIDAMQIYSLKNIKTDNMSKTLSFVVSAIVLFLFTNIGDIAYQLVNPNSCLKVANKFSYFLINLLIMMVITVVIYLPPLVVVLSGIKKRIDYNCDIVKKICGNGDISQRLNISLTDDLGVMTAYMNELMDILSGMIKDLNVQAESVAQSADSLSANADESNSALQLMATELNQIKEEGQNQKNMIMKFSSSIEGLKNGATNLEEFIVAQSTAMKSNSMSIAEMAQNINSVAELTKKAENLSKVLTVTGENGSVVLKEAKQTIIDIQSVSSEVHDIVKVIQQIAAQTNLLSMNASIEAAHAGDYGAGFAVVANEVRTLATDSAASAKNIQTRISDMVSKIDSGVDAIGRTDQAFAEIKQYVAENEKLIQTISRTMEEQRDNANGNMEVTNQVSEELVKVDDLAKQQREYAQSLRIGMEVVVNSADKVNQSISGTTVAADNLKQAVDVVCQTVDSNRDCVKKMQKQLSVFKI